MMWAGDGVQAVGFALLGRVFGGAKPLATLAQCRRDFGPRGWVVDNKLQKPLK